MQNVERELQATVRDSFTLHGVGIHSGHAVAVTVNPAQEGGIRFTRAQSPELAIPAHVTSVRSTPRSTVLAAGGVQVATTEHLLAALWILGVDHAHVVVEGDELPALDGSAIEYVRAIERVGLRTLDTPRRPLALSRPVWVEEGSVTLMAAPSPCLRVSFVLEFPHPVVGTQTASFAVTPAAFAEEIASARTFGLLEWADELRARGLALGASEENTVVVTRDGTLSPLRYPDEFVRHKILDLLGDLALLGRPLQAHVMALRSGHATNVALARRILEAEGPA